MAAPKLKKKKEYEWSGEIRRLIPLQKNGVRVQNELGKSSQYKRDDEKFIIECRRLDEVMGGTITRELSVLGWTEVLEYLGLDD